MKFFVILNQSKMHKEHNISLTIKTTISTINFTFNVTTVIETFNFYKSLWNVIFSLYKTLRQNKMKEQENSINR